MNNETNKNGEVDQRCRGDPGAASGSGCGRAATMEYGDGRFHGVGTLAVRPGHRHPEHGGTFLARDTHPHSACCANAEALVRLRSKREAQSVCPAVRSPGFSCSTEST